MKKPFLFILFVQIQFVVLSQNYESVIDTTKKWNVIFTSYYPEGGVTYNTQSYQIGGDSIINSLQYYKLLINSQFNQEFIREDENHNVYFKDFSDPEYKIYNFNINVGENISLKNMFGMDQVWTVDSIDTIFFVEKERKRISLSVYSGVTDIWIEGIGSLYGLIFSGNVMYDYSTDLLCFYQNGALKYSNPDWNSCNVTSGIKENIKPKIGIFPNPTNGMIKIESPEQIDNISIVDLTGKTIFYTKNKNFDLSAFSKGIYIIKIVTPRGIYNDKILIK